jgi:hypothetical protein
VVGPIVLFIIGIAVLGFLYIALGPLVDGFVTNYNTYSLSTGSYVTTGQTDAINVVLLVWKAIPIIIVLFMVFALIVNSIRDTTGSV